MLFGDPVEPALWPLPAGDLVGGGGEVPPRFEILSG